MNVGNVCPSGGLHKAAALESDEERELIQKIRIGYRQYTLNFCVGCGSAFLTREIVKGETSDDRQKETH